MKIKNNVDLSELERFGYYKKVTPFLKLDATGTYDEVTWNKEYYAKDYFSKEYDGKINYRNIVYAENRLIRNGHGIEDLIKAGLVEKDSSNV